jgi:hypothetical protein
VLVLPFIGEEELYRQFRLNEAWDSPHNRPLLRHRPEVLACDESVEDLASTAILALVGASTLFPPGGGVSSRALTGPGERTLLLLEVSPGLQVPWTAPVDLTEDIGLESLAGSHGDRPLVVTAGGAVEELEPSPNEIRAPDALRRRFDRPGIPAPE